MQLLDMQTEKVKKVKTIKMIKAEPEEQTLAEVFEEMAKPRVAKSAREAQPHS